MTKSDEARRQRNAALLERMKNPADNLSAYDPRATFFPPRPLIQKDREAVERLFGEKTD